MTAIVRQITYSLRLIRLAPGRLRSPPWQGRSSRSAGAARPAARPLPSSHPAGSPSFADPTASLLSLRSLFGFGGFGLPGEQTSRSPVRFRSDAYASARNRRPSPAVHCSFTLRHRRSASGSASGLRQRAGRSLRPSADPPAGARSLRFMRVAGLGLPGERTSRSPVRSLSYAYASARDRRPSSGRITAADVFRTGRKTGITAAEISLAGNRAQKRNLQLVWACGHKQLCSALG